MKLNEQISRIRNIMDLNEQTDTDTLFSLKSRLVLSAQKVYDEWEQDENGYCDMLGEGGICQDIADAMADVLSNNGIECSTVSQVSGEQHVYVVARTEDGVYNVDIPPYLYETGGGYCWKKIPDVEFDERYLVINRLSSDPDEYYDYIGEF
jgi:transglutaminase-like putative cysteine protease